MKETKSFAAQAARSVKGESLEARALECLAELDDARAGLREVLLSLAQQRYPVGSLVDLSRASVIIGDPDDAKRARVRSHETPDVDLERPELTGITMECVTLRRDGVESDNVVWVKAYLLNRSDTNDVDAVRRKWIEMVHALENNSASAVAA